MPDVTSHDEPSLDAFQPLKEAPPDVRKIIEGVLQLEQERLFQRTPRLNEEVLKLIKEEVQ